MHFDYNKVMTEKLYGNIEKVGYSNGRLTIMGWGATGHEGASRSPASICMIRGDKILHEQKCSHARPDVKDYLKSSDENFGFEITSDLNYNNIDSINGGGGGQPLLPYDWDISIYAVDGERNFFPLTEFSRFKARQWQKLLPKNDFKKNKIQDKNLSGAIEYFSDAGDNIEIAGWSFLEKDGKSVPANSICIVELDRIILQGNFNVERPEVKEAKKIADKDWFIGFHFAIAKELVRHPNRLKIYVVDEDGTLYPLNVPARIAYGEAGGLEKINRAEVQIKNEIKILTIDLVDACNLACRTCVRGIKVLPNQRYQMPIQDFEKVLVKAKKAKYEQIRLYNFTEPFLCADLHEYTRLVKKYGFICELSSNFSFRKIPNLVETLKNVDKIYISTSGFTQPVYRINHRGGNVEYVKNNIKLAGEAKARKEIGTKIVIHYLGFPHSLPEYKIFKDFASQWKVTTELIAPDGNPQKFSEEILENSENWATGKILSGFSKLPKPNFTACRHHINFMTLDCHANAYVCCLFPLCESLKIGNFLEDDPDLLSYRALVSHRCAYCLAKDPVRLIDRVIIKELKRGMVKELSGAR